MAINCQDFLRAVKPTPEGLNPAPDPDCGLDWSLRVDNPVIQLPPSGEPLRVGAGGLSHALPGAHRHPQSAGGLAARARRGEFKPAQALRGHDHPTPRRGTSRCLRRGGREAGRTRAPPRAAPFPAPPLRVTGSRANFPKLRRGKS